MKEIDDWFNFKKDCKQYSLIEKIEVVKEYRSITGGQSIYGKVKLVAEPNDKFKFKSTIIWPVKKNPEFYDRMILSGIIDILFSYDLSPILGVSIVLSDIGWEKISSCPIGYYRAARKATEEVVRPYGTKWNYK